MHTPLQESRQPAPVSRGTAAPLPGQGGLGSNTSSSNQLQGGGGSAGGANHVHVSGVRRRNIFSLGKSDQEKVRGELDKLYRSSGTG